MNFTPALRLAFLVRPSLVIDSAPRCCPFLRSLATRASGSALRSNASECIRFPDVPVDPTRPHTHSPSAESIGSDAAHTHTRTHAHLSHPFLSLRAGRIPPAPRLRSSSSRHSVDVSAGGARLLPAAALSVLSHNINAAHTPVHSAISFIPIVLYHTYT